MELGSFRGWRSRLVRAALQRRCNPLQDLECFFLWRSIDVPEPSAKGKGCHEVQDERRVLKFLATTPEDELWIGEDGFLVYSPSSEESGIRACD